MFRKFFGGGGGGGGGSGLQYNSCCSKHYQIQKNTGKKGKKKEKYNACINGDLKNFKHTLYYGYSKAFFCELMPVS